MWEQQNELVEEHLNIVYYIVKNKFSNRKDVKDDLIQEGCMAVVRCSRRWDKCVGVSFKNYCWPRVYGAMHDFLRGKRSGKSIELVPDEFIEDHGCDLEIDKKVAFSTDVNRALEGLSENHRTAILNQVMLGKTQEEIARGRGVSSGAQSQVYTRALANMRKALPNYA